MFYKPEFAVLHFIAVAVGLLLFVLGVRYPRIARTCFALLFSWACVVNWTTVLQRPEVYLDYGPLAVLPLYQQFITGFFARQTVAIVGTIATCQGLIAVGLVLGGRLARVATLGAIVFLIAIAPLGVGSGFPSTLLMAAGAIAILRGSALERPLWRRPEATLHRDPTVCT